MIKSSPTDADHATQESFYGKQIVNVKLTVDLNRKTGVQLTSIARQTIRSVVYCYSGSFRKFVSQFDGVYRQAVSSPALKKPLDYLFSFTQFLRAARGADYRFHDRAAKSPLL
jgi:hypothetical protein